MFLKKIGFYTLMGFILVSSTVLPMQPSPRDAFYVQARTKAINDTFFKWDRADAVFLTAMTTVVASGIWATYLTIRSMDGDFFTKLKKSPKKTIKETAPILKIAIPASVLFALGFVTAVKASLNLPKSDVDFWADHYRSMHQMDEDLISVRRRIQIGRQRFAEELQQLVAQTITNQRAEVGQGLNEVLGADNANGTAPQVVTPPQTNHFFLVSGNVGTDCSICLEPVEAGQGAVDLIICNHTFHRECINLWLDLHHTCPNCRSNLDAQPSP